MENSSDNLKLYGLLGKNISYSLSPVMHNAAFRRFDIKSRYITFDLQENELEDFVDKKLLSGNISGINVTVPYKIMIKKILEQKYADKIDMDGLTEFLGAVNTIRVDENKLTLRNTDAMGFFRALTGRSKYEGVFSDGEFNDMKDKDVLVLGAGGAGRTICLTLMRMPGVQLAGINVYDVNDFVLNDFESYCADNKERKIPMDKISFIKSKDDLERISGQCDLIVNATPVGTKEMDPVPVDPDRFKRDAVVFDLVYTRETELIRRSKERGLKTVNGLGMLVYQGAGSFYIWTKDHWENEGVGQVEAQDRVSKIMFETAKIELWGK